MRPAADGTLIIWKVGELYWYWCIWGTW